MNKRYYKKGEKKNRRKIVRFFGLGMSALGLMLSLYFFFPLLSWQIYLEPVFASQSVETPIPKTTVLNNSIIKSLFETTTQSISGADFYNAQNWFPPTYKSAPAPKINYYTISIPKLDIFDAVVSTVDTDLSQHLVQYAGTVMPPEKGNAVIFGHSTLPQLFDPRNYRTIFANLHTLKIDDTISVRVNNIAHTYKIFKITIVQPDDTSVLTQEYSDSYLTIITCTPPGTIWKRLVIKARLESV